MTTHEIIDDTVAFYGADPVGRRSLKLTETEEHDLVQNACLYIGPGGKKCAFARFVKEEDLYELRQREGTCAGFVLESVTLEDKVSKIKNKMFWNSVQAIHDQSSHWDENGITDQGIEFVQELKDKYPNVEELADRREEAG